MKTHVMGNAGGCREEYCSRVSEAEIVGDPSRDDDCLKGVHCALQFHNKEMNDNNCSQEKFSINLSEYKISNIDWYKLDARPLSNSDPEVSTCGNAKY